MEKLKTADKKSPDCGATVSHVVETADGVEVANVNYATGEVTYGTTECVDENTVNELLKDAGHSVTNDV